MSYQYLRSEGTYTWEDGVPNTCVHDIDKNGEKQEEEFPLLKVDGHCFLVRERTHLCGASHGSAPGLSASTSPSPKSLEFIPWNEKGV